jgi:multiple sugar transport system substrate-binding protein
VRVALAAGLLVAAFAGCGGGGDGQAGSGEPVRFWHAMGGPLGRALNGLVDDFNVGRPAPIESVSMGRYQALSQKLMAAVAAGGPPDIGQCYEAWTANLIDNGSLVPLSEFLEGPNALAAESLADIYEIFLGGASHDGALWSFPFNKSVRCLYYNRDLFREAGLDPDAPPRTWQEYRAMAARLTVDRDGDGDADQYGLASQITVSMFETLLVQNGGSLLNDDETAVAFDSPEGVEALEFMADILVRDGSALLSQGFDYQNDFLAGNVAMIEGSSVSLAFFRDASGEPKYRFDLGIAALPAGKHDVQLVAGTDVVIFRSDPAREAEAWEFVKWFTDTEQTARWAAETGYLPVRRSAMTHPVLLEKLDEHQGLREAYAQLDRALPQPKARGWYAGRQILEREAIEPVLRGRLEPREALRVAAEKANEAL